MSLIRSYLGFDTAPLSVSGFSPQYQSAPHYAWIDQSSSSRQEGWHHATIGFTEDRLEVFNWSSLAYDSAIRWQRSTSFFAEKGMAVGDRMTLLSPDGKDLQPIIVERYFHNVGGMETLNELVARIEPEISWRNPFRGYYMDDEMIAVADCVMSLVNAIRENREPEYGAQQACLDQELVLAMQASAQAGGVPITIPFQLV